MFRRSVKIYWLWLLPVLIAGCQTAPSIKLPAAAATSIKTVRIMPVETPPLEVWPDMLEYRMPNYAHDYNMSLYLPAPYFAEEKNFLNPGGILTAGRVGNGDSVEVSDLTGSDTVRAGAWTPSLELSAAAKSHLEDAQIRAEVNDQIARLPMPDGERNANIGHWRDAVDRWYESHTALSASAGGAADAVLEVGIGRYRIFEDQTSLQVLVKLIDARSGRVIAKTGKNALLRGNTAQGLLYPEGEGFKTLVRANSRQLLAQAIREIGLAPMSLSSLAPDRRPLP